MLAFKSSEFKDYTLLEWCLYRLQDLLFLLGFKQMLFAVGPTAAVGLIACINPKSWSPQPNTTLAFRSEFVFCSFQFGHNKYVALHLGQLVIQMVYGLLINNLFVTPCDTRAGLNICNLADNLLRRAYWFVWIYWKELVHIPCLQHALSAQWAR
jgi:hypothetical protein